MNADIEDPIDPEGQLVADHEAVVAAENDRRRMLYPVRLDPELWRPRATFHPRTMSHEEEDAYRAHRRANRPFRRAFGGGEARRRILLAVGISNAKHEDAAVAVDWVDAKGGA